MSENHAPGSTYGDAVCVTDYDERDYSKEIVITVGPRREWKKWTPEVMPAGAFIAKLCQHAEGTKDGPAFVLGDMVPGQRFQNSMKALHGVGLDIDTGTPSAVVDAAMGALQCQAVRYTTHSHNKTESDFKRDDVLKFAEGRPIDTALLRAFLIEVQRWDSIIATRAEFVRDDLHTNGGIRVVVSHPPMPKHRVVVPFAEPFVIAKEGASQKDALAKWAKVPEALANLLGVPLDRSCRDASRLFYFPRHDKGRGFEISLFGGPYFDWRTLELDNPLERVVSGLGGGKSKSVTEEGRALGPWSRERAHGFQIADVLEAHCPERVRHNTGHGLEIECPFDEAHSNAGDPKDRACLAVNAGEGPSEWFTITCRHDSCHDKRNLDMLGKCIKDGWFERSVLEDETYNAILEEGGSDREQEAEVNEQREEIVRAALNGLTADSSKADVEKVIRLIVENDLRDGDTEVALNVIVEHTGGRKSPFQKRALYAFLADARAEAKKAASSPDGLSSSAKLIQRLNKGRERLFQFPPKHLGNFGLCEDAENQIWLCRENASGSQVRLSAPFMLAGGIIYADREHNRAHRVEFWSPEETWIKLDIESGKLATPTLAMAELMGKGFTVTEQGREFVPQYLSEARPRGLTVVHRAGFRDGYFVCPTGDVLLTNQTIELADDMRLKSAVSDDAANEGVAPKDIKRNGSLKEWKAATKALFAVPKAWRFRAGVLMGHTGPVINLIGGDSVTVELYGKSTHGKSTTQELAASPWANPGLNSGGLFCSAKGTENSQEVLLEISSGTLRALDEAAALSPAVRQNLVFELQGGAGKRRMNRQGGAQKTRTWGGCVLVVSAETGLGQALREAGVKQLGGLSARMLSTTFDDSALLPEEDFALTQQVTANYGWSGPAFVQALADQGYVRDPQRLRDMLEELISKLGAKDAFQRRAARPVACLWAAGQVAAKAGLTPADYNYAALAKRLWKDNLASDTGPTDVLDRAVETLIDSIIARKGREIVNYIERDERGAREAFGYHDATVTVKDAKVSQTVYVLRSTKLAELSGGAVTNRALRDKLKKLGYLVMPPKGRNLTWDYFPGLGKIQYVVLRADKIDAGSEAAVVSLAA